MFALVVRFDIRDAESAEEFDRLTAVAVAKITEREPGTLVYATHTVEDEPLTRLFYEVYVDRDAWQTHEATEHTKAFHAAKNPLVSHKRVEVLTTGPAKGGPAQA